MIAKNFLIILLSLFILIHRAYAFENKKPTQKHFFVKIASHVWYTANKHMLRTEHTKKLFTTQAKSSLLNAAQKVTDLKKLSKIINHFLGKSKFSCARFFSKNDLSFHYLKSVRWRHGHHKIWHIGVMLQEKNNHYIIQSLYQGYPASRVGLRRGDILLYAQNKKFHPITSFSRGKPVTLTILRQNKKLKIRIQPVYESLYDSTKQAIQNSAHLIHTQNLSIGYFHLWVTAGGLDGFGDIKNMFYKKFKNIDGLILDIRNGYSGILWRFTSLFFSGVDQYVALAYRDANGKQHAFPNVLGPTVPYTGPMVVLINENTYGSNEVLAYLFRRAQRALLVGTKTKGRLCKVEINSDNYQNYLFIIPTSTLLIDFVHQINGVGISPDINIPYPIEISTKKDPQLQKSISIITNLIQNRRRKNKTKDQKIYPTSRKATKRSSIKKSY